MTTVDPADAPRQNVSRQLRSRSGNLVPNQRRQNNWPLVLLEPDKDVTNVTPDWCHGPSMVHAAHAACGSVSSKKRGHDRLPWADSHHTRWTEQRCCGGWTLPMCRSREREKPNRGKKTKRNESKRNEKPTNCKTSWTLFVSWS